jgi:hypothetical protein
MKKTAAFLVKVWVKQFYIINAGFLFFIFFFFFGMVNGGQLISYHQSLILAMLISPVLMSIVCLAWLFYNIKCILFCTNTIKSTESTYIFALRALPDSNQILIYLFVSTLLYLPVFAYSWFIVYMAINKFMFLNAMLVAAYQFLMIAFGAYVIFVTINKKRAPGILENTLSFISLKSKIKLGYFGFLVGHFLDEKKMAFLLVKIFSILMLSVSFVINGDHFDEDLFSIFFLLIFVAHAILVFYCVDFSETNMQFTRNLPIAWHTVAGRYLFTYGVFLMPECAFMLVNNHGNLPVTEILLLYLTAVSTLFLCTAYLYGSGLNMENYMFLVFISFLMIFFLQKTGLKLLTMLGICFTAVTIFKSYYYSFEKE